MIGTSWPVVILLLWAVDLSAQPEAPAEVWIDGDSLHWTPVERAVGYQLFREVPVLDRDGELQTAWVVWGLLEADVLSINLREHSLGDDDPHRTPYAVAAVHLIDGQEVESERVYATPLELEGPPTGLRPASWGRIKENWRY